MKRSVFYTSVPACAVAMLLCVSCGSLSGSETHEMAAVVPEQVLSVSPRTLNLLIPYAPQARKIFTLRSADGKPFKVTRVEMPRDGMTAQINDKGPGIYEIVVENIIPNEDLHRQEVVVYTTAHGYEQVRIPFNVSRDG